ncbi:protein rep [Gordonia sp. NPDC062954]|uniref:protein rep n=1 Tax=Gordonia sp. NPDC062954 TaxID=3364003 RepID=UPI0037C80384
MGINATNDEQSRTRPRQRVGRNRGAVDERVATRKGAKRSESADQGSTTPRHVAPLENTRNSESHLSIPGPVDEAGLAQRWSDRAVRTSMMDYLHRRSSLSRVQQCGIVAVGPVHLEVGVPPEGGSRVGRFRGLKTCGSVWACPVCAPKIGRARADQIREGLLAHRGRGGYALFMTLTMHHRAGVDLQELWDDLMISWRSLKQRSTWKYLRQRGVRDLRSIEATWSEQHGWHPHLHALVFVPDASTQMEVLRLWSSLVQDWIRAVDARNPQSNRRFSRTGARIEPAPRGVKYAGVKAQHLKTVNLDDPADLGQYVTKLAWDVPAEIALGAVKYAMSVGDRESRTPFEILAAVATADRTDRDDAQVQRDRLLWYQWERASHGRRQITWCHGLQKDLGLTDVGSDEELASVPEESEQVVFRSVAGFTKHEWSRVPVPLRAALKEELLRVSEICSAETLFVSLRAVAAQYRVSLLTGSSWTAHLDLHGDDQFCTVHDVSNIVAAVHLSKSMR